jgi:WD40 repeat protein
VILELAQDFLDVLAQMPAEHPKHRMVVLLEEAIRRRSHFLARHPTSMFQCLWENCWWFDCPELVKHVARSPGSSDSFLPAGDSPKMYLMLEEWRKHVTRPWLRSVRPPEKAVGQSPHYATIRSNAGWIERILFSPSGEFLAAAGRDGKIAIVDEQLRQVVTQLKHGRPVTALAFASEGLLFSGARDGTICLWDPLRSALQVKASLGNERIMDLALDPQGQFLAAALAGGAIAYCPAHAFPDEWHRIDPQTPQDPISVELQQCIDGDGTGELAISARNDSNHRISVMTKPLRIFSSSRFGRMSEWDSTVGVWKRTDDYPHQGMENRVLAYSRDSKLLLCFEDRRGVFLKVVAAETGKDLCRSVAHRYLVTAANIAGDGCSFVFVTGQGFLVTCPIPRSRQSFKCRVGYSTDVAISPKIVTDVITSHPNGDLRRWDTRRFESFFRYEDSVYDEVVRAAFSPDGSKLFVECFHDVAFEVSDLSQYDVESGVYDCELDRRSPIFDDLSKPFRPEVEWPATAEKSQSNYVLVPDEQEVCALRAPDGIAVGWLPGRRKLLAAHPFLNFWALRDWDRSAHVEIVALEIPWYA